MLCSTTQIYHLYNMAVSEGDKVRSCDEVLRSFNALPDADSHCDDLLTVSTLNTGTFSQ